MEYAKKDHLVLQGEITELGLLLQKPGIASDPDLNRICKLLSILGKEHVRSHFNFQGANMVAEILAPGIAIRVIEGLYAKLKRAVRLKGIIDWKGYCKAIDRLVNLDFATTFISDSISVSPSCTGIEFPLGKEERTLRNKLGSLSSRLQEYPLDEFYLRLLKSGKYEEWQGKWGEMKSATPEFLTSLFENRSELAELSKLRQ